MRPARSDSCVRVESISTTRVVCLAYTRTRAHTTPNEPAGLESAKTIRPGFRDISALFHRLATKLASVLSNPHFSGLDIAKCSSKP